MSFATVQKTIELMFSLFPFCAIVIYPNANYRKKSAWDGLGLRLVLSRLPPFCVFNVAVNRSVYYPDIVVVFTISYHCTIFSPLVNLFYTHISFHCGKLLPDEIRIKRKTELVLCQTRVRYHRLSFSV